MERQIRREDHSFAPRSEQLVKTGVYFEALASVKHRKTRDGNPSSLTEIKSDGKILEGSPSLSRANIDGIGTKFSDKSRLADLLTIPRVFVRTSQVGWDRERERTPRSRDIGVTREGRAYILGYTRAFYSLACPATCLLLDSLVGYERTSARVW